MIEREKLAEEIRDLAHAAVAETELVPGPDPEEQACLAIADFILERPFRAVPTEVLETLHGWGSGIATEFCMTFGEGTNEVEVLEAVGAELKARGREVT